MLSFKQYAFEYTEENLENDIQKLREMFENKFQPNQKVINTILDKIYESEEESVEMDIALRMEVDRFELVVEAAIMAVKTAEDVAERIYQAVGKREFMVLTHSDGLKVYLLKRFLPIRIYLQMMLKKTVRFRT